MLISQVTAFTRKIKLVFVHIATLNKPDLEEVYNPGIPQED
jgi:hypothetical protein